MASIDANGRQVASDFNLEPDPRVLPMLGEINIDQWRCVAELIDNAVDGFLKESRAGSSIAGAKVDVHLPQADSPSATLRMRSLCPIEIFGLNRLTLGWGTVRLGAHPGVPGELMCGDLAAVWLADRC